MDNARDTARTLSPPGVPDPWRTSDSGTIDAIADANLVRGPGRERNLRPMQDNRTARFVVAPHRGEWASGVWSVRRDGVLLALHPSQWEAMLEATERAYGEWSERGARSLVQLQEMDGRLVEARVFGPQRTQPRCGPAVAPSLGDEAQRHH